MRHRALFPSTSIGARVAMRMSLPDSIAPLHHHKKAIEKLSTKRYNWRKQTGDSVNERGCSMPTQEERLGAVEQAIAASQRFQREAVAHIRDTEENTTILLGVIRSQGQDIKRIFTRLETIDQRLETIDQRLDAHTALLNEHTRVLNGHTQVLSEHTRILSEHTTRFDRQEALLTQILERLSQ